MSGFGNIVDFAAKATGIDLKKDIPDFIEHVAEDLFDSSSESESEVDSDWSSDSSDNNLFEDIYDSVKYAFVGDDDE